MPPRALPAAWSPANWSWWPRPAATPWRLPGARPAPPWDAPCRWAAGIALLAGQLTSPVTAFAIAVTVVLVVLLLWRPTPVDPTAGSSGAGALASRELAGRAVVAGGLVALLTLAAPLLGAHLAGLLAAVPLVIGVMAQTTHASSGVASVRSMLRGTVAVVPGSGAFAAVLATSLGVLPVGVAFGGAVTALLVVNAGVARVDVAAWRKR